MRFTWTTSKPPEPSRRSARLRVDDDVVARLAQAPTRPTSAIAGAARGPATSTTSRCSPPVGGAASATVAAAQDEQRVSAPSASCVEQRERHVEHALQRGDG